jgi:hypothetical protein
MDTQPLSIAATAANAIPQLQPESFAMKSIVVTYPPMSSDFPNEKSKSECRPNPLSVPADCQLTECWARVS